MVIWTRSEVTSAALWLNEKAPGDDLITCIQLTPFRDEAADSLYVQANTIIPVPGVDEYVIGTTLRGVTCGFRSLRAATPRLRCSLAAW